MGAASGVTYQTVAPGYLLWAMGTALIVCAAAIVLMKRLRARQRSRVVPTQRDWSIPEIACQSRRESFFHRWEPATKIAALVFCMFCIASLTHLDLACAALALAALAVTVARIPWRQPLRRLGAMAAFLTMFLVVMPLTVPLRSGDTLLLFGDWHALAINLRGLRLAGLICLKAAAVALLADPLLATAPFPTTVQGLVRLRVPPVVCQMILLAHRYLFVFDHEASRMNRSMASRGFRKRTNLDTLRTLGNFLGMLLVRSFERTQRVYEAMLARGYHGRMPAAELAAPAWRDWVKTALCAMLGLALALADQL